MNGLPHTAASPTSIAACLDGAARRLAAGNSPRLDAEVLLAHVLGTPRSHLRARPEYVLSAKQYRHFLELVARRAGGEPVAYLIGRREFWSLTLAVNRHTLIPRADTERLVELALERLPLDDASHVADIGTGSGAIALAIAGERPRSRLIATDISAAALAVARANAAALRLDNVEFRHGDGLAPLAGGIFDMICSNPPYIAEGDPHLESGDLPAEPRTALVAGPSGLEIIDALARGARHCLRAGGWLLLEHGHDQGERVAALLRSLDYHEIATFRDYAGKARVTLGRRAQP